MTFNFNISSKSIITLTLIILTLISITFLINNGSDSNQSPVKDKPNSSQKVYPTDTQNQNNKNSTSKEKSKNTSKQKKYLKINQNDFDSIKMLWKPKKEEANVIEVRHNSKPVQGAKATINGDLVGQTTKEGLLFFQTTFKDMKIKIEKEKNTAEAIYEY